MRNVKLSEVRSLRLEVVRRLREQRVKLLLSTFLYHLLLKRLLSVQRSLFLPFRWCMRHWNLFAYWRSRTGLAWLFFWLRLRLSLDLIDLTHLLQDEFAEQCLVFCRHFSRCSHKKVLDAKKPNATEFINLELNSHTDQVLSMDFLKVEAYFVTYFLAVERRCCLLKLFIVPELLEVEFYFAIVLQKICFLLVAEARCQEIEFY